MITTAPKIGDGTTDNPFRPDLPEGTSYSVLADNGDTFEVDVQQDPAEQIATLQLQLAEQSALIDALLILLAQDAP